MSSQFLEDHSWAWKQGWLRYKRDPWTYENPHPKGTEKHTEFKEGWDEANFDSAVEGGYFDWR